MIDYRRYQQSLQHLSSQVENRRVLDAKLPLFIQVAVAESVIQRFEVCYDCLWKLLKRFLSEELGFPEAPNSPKPIFRLAHENDLLPSSIEQFLLYADLRNGVSHDYSGKKAKDALAIMEEFVRDAIMLYQRMSGLEWENLC